jgi:predicted MFS family arabinose efflux permease
MPLRSAAPAASDAAAKDPNPWLILSLAIACGVTVANIYYAQPLIGPIGQTFGIDLAKAGLIVTMLQVGYVFGLLFLAPLGDLVENKALILTTLGGVVVSLVVSAMAPSALVFVAASLLLGVTATGTQMIVPMAAHLTPERSRGQIVGTVMSGLLIGILLARPLATLVAGPFGWRAIYILSAVAMCLVVLLLVLALPRRKPASTLGYGALIRSLWDVLVDNPVLQRRAFYQALLFAAFTLFWTAMPLVLQEPPFSLGHLALSAFLLSGVAGAFVAPLAGRLADRGYSDSVTVVSMVLVIVSFAVAWIGSTGSIAIMVMAGVLLDAGTQGCHIASQRMIYNLPADIRSRLNALYLAIFFFGGAAGSAISGFAVDRGGAPLVCGIGFAIGLVPLAAFLLHRWRAA